MTGITPVIACAINRVYHSIIKLRRAREGIAALEFALLTPIAIYILLIGFDLASALLVVRRLTNAADVVAQLVSQQTDTNGVEGTITDSLLFGDFASVIATFPNVLADAANKGDIPPLTDIQVIASQVEFGPESSTCVVPNNLTTSSTPTAPVCNTANVIWSFALNAPSAHYPGQRACGLNTLTETKSTAAVASPSLTTMPHYLYAPGDVIVADVFYSYTPMFTKWITGSYTFQRTAYMAPRFFTKLTYSPTGAKPGQSSGNVTPYTDANYTVVGCSFTGTVP